MELFRELLDTRRCSACITRQLSNPSNRTAAGDALTFGGPRTGRSMPSTNGTSTLSKSSGYEEYAFIADLYDHVVPYRDRSDVGFFVDAATRAGSPVLEIGCGTGRVLIPTAREGLDIVGLDSSPHMLAVCRQRLLDEPEAIQKSVQLVQADMRQFSLDRRFTLVTIPFRPFQHLLTVDDQFACLAQVHRHLVDDGVLILDISTHHSLSSSVRLAKNVATNQNSEPDGRRGRSRHKTVARDRFNQVSHFELIYYVTHSDGRAERLVHAFPMRYLFRFEAEHCWPALDSRSCIFTRTTTRVHMAQSILASSCSWRRGYERE